MNDKKNDLEVPFIPATAKLTNLHRRPQKDAALPEEQVKLRLQKHILAWFQLESKRQNKNIDVFINEALRQYVIQKVGDPEFQVDSLNSVQRAEVQAIVKEMLATESETSDIEAI